MARGQPQRAGGRTLSINGAADHDPSADLIAEQVAQVAAGARATRSLTLSF